MASKFRKYDDEWVVAVPRQRHILRRGTELIVEQRGGRKRKVTIGRCVSEGLEYDSYSIEGSADYE